MTALLVIGIIVAVLALLMLLDMTMYVSITDAVRIRVGILCFRQDVLSPELEQEKEKKEEKPKKKKKAKPKKKQSKKTKKKPKEKPKKDFADTIRFILDLIRGIFDPVTFVLRHVRLTNVDIQIAVGAEEADKTALTYAGISIAVHNVLALLKSQIVVKIKQVRIWADFEQKEIIQDVHFRVKLRIGVIIAGGLGMLYHIVKNLLAKQTKSVKQTEKTKEQENENKEGA